MRWADMRRKWDEKGWKNLRRAEISWKEMRLDELRRLDMRRALMSWDERRGTELTQAAKMKKLRRAQKRRVLRWAEKRREKLRWHKKRWEQLWSAEKSWDKEKRHEMRWDETRWDGMKLTAVIGCNEQFPREAATRWDQMKWEKVQLWQRMAREWKIKRSLLWSTEGLPPSYRHILCSALQTRRSNFETSAPGLPRYYLIGFGT